MRSPEQGSQKPARSPRIEARDIMTTQRVTVGPDDTIEAAAETLQTNGGSGAPVVSDGKLEGIVTANDVVRSFTGISSRGRHAWHSFLSNPTADFVRSHGTRLRDVMTRDVMPVAEEAPLAEIAAILAARNIRRVPVVGGGSLVGIVSRADILRAMVALSRSRAAGPSADDRTLRPRILPCCRRRRRSRRGR